MVAINHTYKRKIEKFYFENCLSAKEIALKLGFSIDAVYYFMRKHEMKRRDLREVNKIRFLNKEPSFVLNNIKNDEKKELKTIGVMLYWAEGSKWEGETIVDFANSDKDMVVLFLSFLREVCGVKESKLRAFCYLYANQNASECINYWSRVTKIPKLQFTKPYIRLDYNSTKKHKMPYGLIHIRYADKKLLLLIKNWIEEYKSKNTG